MEQVIKDRLEAIGDTSAIDRLRQTAGGDINQAFYVESKNRQYFIKGNQDIPSHFFKAEARGLDIIRDTQAIAVPEVLYYDEPSGAEKGLIIMEWINGKVTETTIERLGRNLAFMHSNHNNRHGFEEDTFIGTLPQPNGFFDNWITYYRDQRLLPQFETAAAKGRMPVIRRKQMESLLNSIDSWFNGEVPASLLHGDLWGGNWLAGPDGEPYLIDPSVFYGDRAFELAFTELFGGFPNDFYHAYQEISPLPYYYQDIKPLYQLYYLLVHLNIFGEAYGSSVDRILNRYAKLN
ncbi:fructosamine kinase family protein [Sediminibacillus albus]|uniref:Fructosamine-3-kinase n=1 Tax=Sediminibacillus albus TaxID=407036 RepID=A0A1G8ZNW4_9BACI|nr:fructosamine kinase family protein [Sediminibacillus albus]SDK16703.1 Fructosamine-3-kinase [Sediminibacillus albus]